MSQLERFGKYSKEAATKARQEEASTGWRKWKDGTNIVRVLPPLLGMEEPWVKIYQHFIKIPGAPAPLVFNCPRRMKNAPCPSCEKGDRLKASGNPVDEKAARDWYAGERNIGYVIDRDDPDSGVQLQPFGSTIKKRLRHFREKLGKDYTDLENGYDIVVEKMGSGMDTEYQTDLGEQGPVLADMKQFEKWVEELPELTSFTKVLDYDTLVEKFGKAAGGGVSVGATRPRAIKAAPSAQDDANDLDDGGDPY